MSEPIPTSYDLVPYESRPTHPDRLAIVTTLFGMRPPVNRCRVLELGCASGGNLIPILGNRRDVLASFLMPAILTSNPSP